MRYCGWYATRCQGERAPSAAPQNADQAPEDAQCGFSLSDIAQLLDLRAVDKSCYDDVRRVAIEKQLALKQRIRTLTDMAQVRDPLIAACGGSSRPIDECPILAAMDSEPRADAPLPPSASRTLA